MRITITGRGGVGKSTIAKLLAEKLNIKHYSVGDFRREIAEKRRITLEQLNKEDEQTFESDKLADEWQRKLGKEEDNFVIDGRLTAYFIPNSIKILLNVKPEVGAERVFEYRKNSAVESYKSVEEVMKKLKERDESDRKRYKSLYNVEYDNMDFDLVIDTTDKTPEQIVKEIVEFVRKDRKSS
ncbi:(d)CMP kinase [Candidatus Woesearchaeota archaeon]|nr:(d)CMP kinase [Candidatus Woesearchaeota archaeon]